LIVVFKFNRHRC